MMPFRFGPCATCCDVETCFYFSDDFNRSDDTDLGANWTEVPVDQWEIASNVLSTSSDDAICKCATDGVLSYVARVVMKGGSVGDEFRLLFNYIDDENYSYVRVERTFTTEVQVKLVSVVATTHTVDDSSTSFTHNLGTDSLWVQVCVHEGTANASTGTTGNFSLLTARAAAVMDTVTGTCGVGTGTNGTTAVTFDTFSIQKHSTVQTGCPDCPFECDHCVDDIASDRYQVVITGAAAVAGNDCPDFNGTWIVAPTNPCRYSSGDQDFIILPVCNSKAQVLLEFGPASDIANCNDPPTDVHALHVWLTAGHSSTVCTLSLCTYAFKHSQVARYDCDDINNLSLTIADDPDGCDVSGATCVVTSL